VCFINVDFQVHSCVVLLVQLDETSAIGASGPILPGIICLHHTTKI
jgi:hypothetical protein